MSPTFHTLPSVMPSRPSIRVLPCARQPQVRAPRPGKQGISNCRDRRSLGGVFSGTHMTPTYAPSGSNLLAPALILNSIRQMPECGTWPVSTRRIPSEVNSQTVPSSPSCPPSFANHLAQNLELESFRSTAVSGQVHPMPAEPGKRMRTADGSTGVLISIVPAATF